MARLVLVIALVLGLASTAAAGRLLLQAATGTAGVPEAAPPSDLSSRFTLAPVGTSCQTVCSSIGKQDAFFRPSLGGAQAGSAGNATSICAVQTSDNGWVTGYQFRDGSSQCAIVADNVVKTSDTYACLCLTSTETQAMAAHNQSDPAAPSCAQTCATGFPPSYLQDFGTVTGGVSADVANPLLAGDTCVAFGGAAADLPYLPIGTTNGTSCSAAVGESVLDQKQFSCFCIFDKVPAPSVAVAKPNTAPLAAPIAISSAGR